MCSTVDAIAFEAVRVFNLSVAQHQQRRQREAAKEKKAKRASAAAAKGRGKGKGKEKGKGKGKADGTSSDIMEESDDDDVEGDTHGGSGGGAAAVEDDDMDGGVEEDVLLCRTDRCSCWVADPRGSFLVGAENKKLIVVFLLENGATRRVKHKHNGTISCLAIHPEEACIAVGDTRGQIVLYRDFDGGRADSAGSVGEAAAGSSSGEPIKTTLHWHAHGVSALQFNSDGAYLLSGGEEAVLVIWQVASSVQRFLPRLGAPFSGVAISHDDTKYATCHVDNTIRIVDAASLEEQKAVHGLRRTPTGAPAHALKCGLQAAPSEGQVVLNGA